MEERVVTIYTFCLTCDYEDAAEISIVKPRQAREFAECCPLCGGFLEREFDPPQLDVETFTISDHQPHQTSAGASGTAWQEGTNVTIFWDLTAQSFGYCFHGVDRNGNAFETDDIIGFSTTDAAREDAELTYKERTL